MAELTEKDRIDRNEADSVRPKKTASPYRGAAHFGQESGSLAGVQKVGVIAQDRLLHSLRARVDVLRNEMNAARLEYLRAQLELRTLQGDKHEADRTARQIRNLLHAERPRKARKARS